MGLIGLTGLNWLVWLIRLNWLWFGKIGIFGLIKKFRSINFQMSFGSGNIFGSTRQFDDELTMSL